MTLVTSLEVSRVPQDQFIQHWPRIREELHKIRSVWEQWWTEEHIYNAVLAGHFQVWGLNTETQLRLVVFTQLVTYPSGRVLQLVLAFGNSLEEGLPILEATLEKFAKDMGCSRMEIFGRPGWGRLLKRAKQVSVIFSTDVDQGRLH